MNSTSDAGKVDMKTLVKDAQQLFHDAASATGQQTEELHAKGSALLGRSADSARRAQDSIIESSKEIGTSADHLVRTNTWTAVAISGAVGVLVGYLIART